MSRGYPIRQNVWVSGNTFNKRDSDVIRAKDLDTKTKKKKSKTWADMG